MLCCASSTTQELATPASPDDFQDDFKGTLIEEYDLPYEVTVAILSFLSPADIARAARVCFLWSDASKETKVWRSIYARIYGDLTTQASIIVDKCLSSINFLKFVQGRKKFDVEELRLGEASYFDQVVVFLSRPATKRASMLRGIRLNKRKVKQLTSDASSFEKLMQYCVYVVHLVEQLGIHVDSNELKSADGTGTSDVYSNTLLFLTDFLSRVVMELHQAGLFEWARVVNDADFALSSIGMALNDTSVMNNHAASWIQKAQVAMLSQNELERREVARMFEHAQEILYAMPEWDMLKYYNLACCFALQSHPDDAKYWLKLTFGDATDDDWHKMREICHPFQEKLNPSAIPNNATNLRTFPPIWDADYLKDMKGHALEDPDLASLRELDWFKTLTDGARVRDSDSEASDPDVSDDEDDENQPQEAPEADAPEEDDDEEDDEQTQEEAEEEQDETDAEGEEDDDENVVTE